VKLLRVKILGESFRSLTANKDYEFNWTESENRLSNKVFAGLNGSGKSNFLELLAEIFYFLERCHLSNTPDEYKRNINVGFEIEYILPSRNIIINLKKLKFIDDLIHSDLHVKIIKLRDEFPEFSYSKVGKNEFIRLDSDTEQLLPSKVIAYTSGQNELLSNPFVRLKYQYFNEVKFKDNHTNFDRLFFLNEDSNYAIFVSVLLLATHHQLYYFKKLFRINDLCSFRITFNYKYNTKEALLLFKKKMHLLEPLKACATSWVDNKENKCLTLDFEITKASHQAFTHFYRTPFKLFKTFYELDTLNLLLDKAQTKKFVEVAHKSINITDELSKKDPSDLIFRIEKIKVTKLDKDGNPFEIFYKSLSDGEHQFNEVVGSVMMMEEEGCLFLLDEPDTHFNPKWRAKTIEMLNHVAANSYTANGKPEFIRKQEIIITTHSPFIISDSKREDVYKFERVAGELFLKNPKTETYGSSITYLMKEIFNRDITISDFANNELEGFRDELKNLDDSVDRKEKVDLIKEKLLDFGESVEKFDLYTYLNYLNRNK
jgi:restriction system-associated AAA family ATPase